MWWRDRRDSDRSTVVPRPPRPGARKPAKARRLALVLGQAAALAACGFRPLYGEAPGAPAPAAFAETRVAVIPDRIGQILRNQLIARLNPAGRPATPGYVLDVDVAESSQELNVQGDDTATRANLIVTASYRLTTAAGDPVTAGSVQTVTSYNILRDEFATVSAARDARERALRQISEEIRTRLALHFQRES